MEQRWIDAAKAGNRDALVHVLRSVEPALYRTAYYFFNNEADAKDATQDALLKIYMHIHTYEGQSAFRTWAQRIVTNICIDRTRRQKSQVSIEEHELEFLAWDPSVETQLITEMTMEEIRAAMDQLPGAHRTVVILRYVEQLSYSEIAEVMSIPLNSVKSLLYRAREKLMGQLAHLDPRTRKEGQV